MYVTTLRNTTTTTSRNSVILHPLPSCSSITLLWIPTLRCRSMTKKVVSGTVVCRERYRVHTLLKGVDVPPTPLTWSHVVSVLAASERLVHALTHLPMNNVLGQSLLTPFDDSVTQALRIIRCSYPAAVWCYCTTYFQVSPLFHHQSYDAN